MKIEILDALIKKWDLKNKKEGLEPINADPAYENKNNKKEGIQIGRQECIEDLTNLIKLLG